MTIEATTGFLPQTAKLCRENPIDPQMAQREHLFSCWQKAVGSNSAGTSHTFQFVDFGPNGIKKACISLPQPNCQPKGFLQRQHKSSYDTDMKVILDQHAPILVVRDEEDNPTKLLVLGEESVLREVDLSPDFAGYFLKPERNCNGDKNGTIRDPMAMIYVLLEALPFKPHVKTALSEAVGRVVDARVRLNAGGNGYPA